MNISKVILSIFLVLALIIGTGCGNGEKQDTNKQQKTKKETLVKKGTKSDEIKKSKKARVDEEDSKKVQKRTKKSEQKKNVKSVNEGESEKKNLNKGNKALDKITKDKNETKRDSKKGIKKSSSPPNIKGTYIGTFGKHPATLEITRQNGNQFNGVFSIHSPKVQNKKVKGNFNKKSKKIFMRDLLNKGVNGKYRGKIDFNGQKITGTFLANKNGSKKNFSLKEKSKHLLKEDETKKSSSKKEELLNKKKQQQLRKKLEEKENSKKVNK